MITLQAGLLESPRTGGDRLYQHSETEQSHVTPVHLAHGKVLVGLKRQNKIYLHTKKKLIVSQ